MENQLYRVEKFLADRKTSVNKRNSVSRLAGSKDSKYDNIWGWRAAYFVAEDEGSWVLRLLIVTATRVKGKSTHAVAPRYRSLCFSTRLSHLTWTFAE